MRRLLSLSTLFLAACATPTDAFVLAERSLLRQDLPGALVAFDTVPVSHERYPEARATALGVEQRMRRGHELLLEALLLRAEWRDREALAVLRRAQHIWPHMPSVDALITATEHRFALLGGEPDQDDVEPVTVVPVLPRAAAVQSGVAAEGRRDELLARSAVAQVRQLPAATGSVDPVASGLVAVEMRLGRGELEAAVIDLIELSRRFPQDARVRLRLSRVLHQRALQHYAHGHWERVIILDPDNALAGNLLQAARAVAAAPSPR